MVMVWMDARTPRRRRPRAACWLSATSWEKHLLPQSVNPTPISSPQTRKTKKKKVLVRKNEDCVCTYRYAFGTTWSLTSAARASSCRLTSLALFLAAVLLFFCCAVTASETRCCCARSAWRDRVEERSWRREDHQCDEACWLRWRWWKAARMGRRVVSLARWASIFFVDVIESWLLKW